LPRLAPARALLTSHSPSLTRTGTDIGSAFAPPDVFVGINADARCVVQPFTSSRNRLHCIVDAEGLPPPDTHYDARGRFASHPLRLVVNGRIAQCWHTGGSNHGCFVRFDVAGTPRVDRLLTPVVQQGGLVRVRGRGIDGGLLGAPGLCAPPPSNSPRHAPP
jgi:hypothetical protein